MAKTIKKPPTDAVVESFVQKKGVETLDPRLEKVNKGKYLEGIYMSFLDDGEFGGVYHRNYYFQNIPRGDLRSATFIISPARDFRRFPCVTKRKVVTKQ